MDYPAHADREGLMEIIKAEDPDTAVTPPGYPPHDPHR